MNKFFIVTNLSKDPEGIHAARLKDAICRRGGVCTGEAFSSVDEKGGYTYTGNARIPEGTEAVLSLGGDGTFIHVLKEIQGSGIPVFGINFGTLGFLTEVSGEEAEGALEKIMQGSFQITEHIMLEGTVMRGGETVSCGLALNDIVFNRALSTGIAAFDVYVDGTFLNNYPADGIIIATPIGSTGYNLSAGGPVVQPSAEIILVTPLSAHTLNSRSIVFPANMEIEVLLARTGREIPQKAYVTLDGENYIPLQEGDSVKIKMAPERAKVIRTDKASFVEQIGKKMR